MTAEDAEKLDKRKKRKKNADVGFSGDKLSGVQLHILPPPPHTMTQCSLLILTMKNNKPKEINYKHSGSEFVKCCNVDV